jgi:hypothetical protein
VALDLFKPLEDFVQVLGQAKLAAAELPSAWL